MINSLLDEKGKLNYLGAFLQTDALSEGVRFLDLSNENRKNLIEFGQRMKLENKFDILKRWVFTSRLGKCLGGDEKILKMARDKLKVGFQGLEFGIPTGATEAYRLRVGLSIKVPSKMASQTEALERLVRVKEGSEFKIAVVGDQFKILINGRTRINTPVNRLLTEEELRAAKPAELLRQKLFNAKKEFLVTIKRS